MGNKCSHCVGRKETKGGGGDTATGLVFGGRMSAGDRVIVSIEGTNPLVKKIHTKADFDSALSDSESSTSKKLLIASFYAPWCGPCQIVSPRVDKFATEFVNIAIFAKINVDENDELASVYGISCIPTFVIFAKGEKVDEISGANVDKLRQLIGKHTGQDNL